MAARNKAWKKANYETVKATNSAWQIANRERRNETLKAWRAADPERRRAVDRARRERNADRINAYKSEWRDRNRERLRRQDAERRARDLARTRAAYRLSSHLRRARERSALIAPFNNAQLMSRVAYWGGRCYVCHAPWEAIDHVKPLSKGGAHCLSNLRPICGYHNNRKKNRWRGVAWIREVTGAGDIS